jgi:hypothetical protein
MSLNESRYIYQKAIERIDITLAGTNKSHKDIVNLDGKNIIPNNVIKPESFYSINSELALFIKIDFHEKKVPLLKYKCCISEINAALHGDPTFKFDIYTNNNFILAKYDLWGAYKDPYFIDYFNKIRLQFYSTSLRVASIIDILNVKFKVNGYSCIEVKIGISCRKLKEAEKMCLLCPENVKIMLDQYAFDYISSLLDEDNKQLLKINNALNCYQGNLINKEMNEWVIKNSNFQSFNPSKSNAMAAHNTGHGLDKTTIKSVICPMCNGDGGTRGGCFKCEGTGWVTEKDKSNYSPLPEALYGGRDDSKISNYNYIGGHIGAHYRDRDGSIGSIPDYDEDE